MKRSLAVMALACSLVVVAADAADPVIRWEPFELRGAPEGLRAQLGRITVPLIRAQPDAGAADLVLVRLQARNRGTGAPIAYLDGGPGGSAISATRSSRALENLARLAEIGDVILLDQRGVGLSAPRPVCKPPVPLEPREKFIDPAASLVRSIANTRACVAEWKGKGVDVRGFTNYESAADLDDVRKALGVPKISLFGFSYGTHLGLAALRYFGPSIERAVFLGTEGPDHTRKLPSTLDTQLAKLSWMAANDASIGREVPDMSALFRRVLARLEKEPMMVTVTDRARKGEVQVPVNADALRRLLIFDIGDGNDFTVFPALLLTIEQGDPSILSWFVEKRYNQITGGVDLMALGMECSSGATENRDRQIRIEAQSSPFRTAMNFPYPEICAALPPVDLGDAFRGPLVSDVPVLFVSGTLDSNTPPFQAEQLRWGMPRASHLIVENAGHEDTLPIAEVQAVIRDFFAGKDTSGRRVSLPVPDFKSVEEAKRERRRR